MNKYRALQREIVRGQAPGLAPRHGDHTRLPGQTAREIVRDLSLLDSTEGLPARDVVHNHAALDAENEKASCWVQSMMAFTMIGRCQSRDRGQGTNTNAITF